MAAGLPPEYCSARLGSHRGRQCRSKRSSECQWCRHAALHFPRMRQRAVVSPATRISDGSTVPCPEKPGSDCRRWAPDNAAWPSFCCSPIARRPLPSGAACDRLFLACPGSRGPEIPLALGCSRPCSRDQPDRIARWLFPWQPLLRWQMAEKWRNQSMYFNSITWKHLPVAIVSPVGKL